MPVYLQARSPSGERELKLFSRFLIGFSLGRSPSGERELKRHPRLRSYPWEARSPSGERELKPSMLLKMITNDARSPSGERELKHQQLQDYMEQKFAPHLGSVNWNIGDVEIIFFSATLPIWGAWIETHISIIVSLLLTITLRWKHEVKLLPPIEARAWKKRKLHESFCWSSWSLAGRKSCESYLSSLSNPKASAGGELRYLCYLTYGWYPSL